MVAAIAAVLVVAGLGLLVLGGLAYRQVRVPGSHKFEWGKLKITTTSEAAYVLALGLVPLLASAWLAAQVKPTDEVEPLDTTATSATTTSASSTTPARVDDTSAGHATTSLLTTTSNTTTTTTPPTVALVDSDSDGTQDAADRCPVVAGPAANDGCPWTVPPISTPLDEVLLTVERAGAVPSLSFRPTGLDDVDQIISVDPAVGTQLESGTVVRLTVSTGEASPRLREVFLQRSLRVGGDLTGVFAGQVASDIDRALPIFERLIIKLDLVGGVITILDASPDSPFGDVDFFYDPAADENLTAVRIQIDGETILFRIPAGEPAFENEVRLNLDAIQMDILNGIEG